MDTSEQAVSTEKEAMSLALGKIRRKDEPHNKCSHDLLRDKMEKTALSAKYVSEFQLRIRSPQIPDY